jgi:hypothetical protein
MAVQVDPIKPTLKAPGTKHLKAKCEELLSNFGYKLNLRRYTVACVRIAADVQVAATTVGADTRPTLSST